MVGEKDLTIEYVASQISPDWRRKISEWFKRELPQVDVTWVFQTDIVIKDGRPVSCRVHAFAKNAEGNFYPDETGVEVAQVPVEEYPITTEPEL